MSIKNLKSFVMNYAKPMSNELAINTISQYGGWDAFKEIYADVCDTGIAGGYKGWDSADKVVDFYEANKSQIDDYAQEMAYDIGYESVEHMIGMFGFLRGAYSEQIISEAMNDCDHEAYQAIANALGWFVAEELARSYEQLVENATFSAKVTSNKENTG